ncbi:MAG TPA: hypothetical protein VKO43_03515 [Candidatus Krumholzibacteriaceae bacterium]|nr:hypothetical protein [Candidatus Krumholzibacteriaceae bacterium]
MKFFSVITVFIIAVSISSPAPCAEGIKDKEIIGFRIGSIFNSNKFDNAFGKGSELELHFIEGLGSWYGVDISLSSHNFGDSKLPEKDFEYVGYDETLELQIYSINAAIFICYSLSGKLTATFESGAGLYAITLIRPLGFFQQRMTDYQPGISGGIGLLYRFSKSDISINLNAKYHYISSGGDNTLDHPLLFYTGEERTAFLQICAGITLTTG